MTRFLLAGLGLIGATPAPAPSPATAQLTRGDDRELTIGAQKIKMSELKVLYPDDRKDPRAETLDGTASKGRGDGLGQVRPGPMGPLPMMWAERIGVEACDKPTPDLPVVTEARIGPKVEATIEQKVRVKFRYSNEMPR